MKREELANAPRNLLAFALQLAHSPRRDTRAQATKQSNQPASTRLTAGASLSLWQGNLSTASTRHDDSRPANRDSGVGDSISPSLTCQRQRDAFSFFIFNFRNADSNMTTELEALEQSTAESPEQHTFKDKLSIWVGNEKILDFTFKEPANLDAWVPKPGKRYRNKWRDVVEPDLAEEAWRNRFRIERYNAEFPENENPEHTLWSRGSRNASPTRKKDAGQLNAFWDYRELNKSVEPLQSNYLQADNDNYDDPEREEGDAEQPERDAEAELETRPGLNELVDLYSAPAVQYETQQVGLITGPRLSDCGYCMAPTSSFIREMKIPVSGDVECIGFHKDRLLEYEHAARMSLAGLGIRRTRKQINAYVDKIAKPELLNISDVAKDRKWTIYQIGDLRFAPYRTKHHYRGQVTHYRDNGRWFRAKEDEYGTPYGPKSKGSDDAAWVPRHPRTSESSVVMLSPAALAKQWANEDKPLPCPLPTDEALEDSRRKLEANGKPANDNQHHDGLPYDMESADELQFGYAFGTKYPETSDPEPFDDVVERKSLLAALNARLSPQARRVAPMVVVTDETEMLAQTYEEVGVALHAGRRNASVSTLKRHGKLALANAAAEINKIRQELAA